MQRACSTTRCSTTRCSTTRCSTTRCSTRSCPARRSSFHTIQCGVGLLSRYDPSDILNDVLNSTSELAEAHIEPTENSEPAPAPSTAQPAAPTESLADSVLVLFFSLSHAALHSKQHATSPRPQQQRRNASSLLPRSRRQWRSPLTS